MNEFDDSVPETEMKDLREGIKNKYKQYHLLDRDRFPEFEYNTNRANYEPLRLSFDEEFFVVRQLNRTQNSIHIPSTNTLALIFCDDKYVPGRKIFDTCRSYAEGKTQVVISNVIPTISQPKAAIPVKFVSVLVVSIVLLAGLAIYTATTRLRFTSPASGLIINRPGFGQNVPRQLLVNGIVANADTIWIVIHPVGGMKYWVQPPIKVETDGTWKGIAYIGSVDKGDIGITSQLRAFVNPNMVLREGDILRSWPEAELSSNAIEVVRGPKEIEE